MLFLGSELCSDFHFTSRIKKQDCVMICKALISDACLLSSWGLISYSQLFFLTCCSLPIWPLLFAFNFLSSLSRILLINQITGKTGKLEKPFPVLIVHGTQPHARHSPVMLLFVPVISPPATHKQLSWQFLVHVSLVPHFEKESFKISLKMSP